MKSIRQKMLVFVILPFLMIYSILSVFIVYEAYQTQFHQTGNQLHHMAVYNAVNLKSRYDIIELSAKICAAELEKINPYDPSAREKGENIITARFYNPDVFCVWLAFEPDAFDGRDAFHTKDYPGFPSGRYFRSFVRDGDSWKTEKITEAQLDDPAYAYWYHIPRKTGTLYTGLGSNELFWDYGDGPVSSFTVAVPIFRGRKIIGCVGLDSKIDEQALGDKINPKAVSAIFLSDGRLGYSLETEKVGKTLEELGFTSHERIRTSMQNRESLYLYNEYSKISGVRSYVYFYPFQINDTYIYIYTSLPQTEVLRSVFPVLLPFGISLLASLIIFLLLFLYLSRGIAWPLKRLSQTSEAIALGYLDAHIDIIRSGDEMGMISKSLALMAEQFRTSKILQEQYQDRIDIILRIHYAVFRTKKLDEAFSTALFTIADYLDIFKATLVFLIRESPRIISVYPSAAEDEENSEFFAHNQVVRLLKDKKHLTMNYGTLRQAKLPFVDSSTKSLCVLPLRTKDVLRGYIIMEGKKQETLIHDDTTLLFLGDTLSYVLKYRVDEEKGLTEPDEAGMEFTPSYYNRKDSQEDVIEDVIMMGTEDFWGKAKSIQNLNIEKGIRLVGGEREKYAELLQVAFKVISEAVVKMRRLYNEDLRAFAIEIHSMKASLYTIGAEALGDEARQMEFAAKSDDAEYCEKNYPLLEEKLKTLSRNLAALFPQQKQNLQKGSVVELEETLKKAKEACEDFDITAANSLLEPLSAFTWDNEMIGNSLKNILSDLENLEYTETAVKISVLLEVLEGYRQ